MSPGSMFRSGGFALASNGATLIVSAGSFLILARALSPVEFGIWALFVATATFVDMARVGLVVNAFIKFAAAADEERWKSLMTSGLVISAGSMVIAVGAVMGMSGFLSRLWDASLLRNLFMDYWVMAIPYTPVIVARYMQQARSDFRAELFTNLVYRGTFLVGLVVELVAFGRIYLSHLPWLFGLGGLLATPVGLGLVRSDLRFGHLNWQEVGKLLHFGKYVFATSFGSIIAGRADLMMLGAMAPAASVAIYNIPQRIGGYVDVPLSSVSTVTYSRASAVDVTDTAKFRWLYERSVGVMLAMLLPAIVVILAGAPWIVLLVAGDAYEGTAASTLLMIIALLSIPKAYGRQFGITMDALGLPYLNAANLWGSLAVNVVLNLLLIPMYGVYGAMAATGVSMFLGTVTAVLILRWKLGVSVWRPLFYAWEFYGEAVRYVMQLISQVTGGSSEDKVSGPAEEGPGKDLR